LPRLHAGGGERLDHAGVDAFEDLHQRADPVRLGIRQHAGVLGVQLDEVLAAAFQRDVGDHAGLAKLVLLSGDARLGIHLGLADRALLLLDRDLGVELALADGTLLLDREIAPREDRLVRRLEDRLARLRLQRLRGIGRRLHRADGDAEDLEPERGDVGAVFQAARDCIRNAVGGAQRFFQRHLLDELLRQHLDRAEDALGQLFRIIGLICLAVALQREVEHRGGLPRLADAVGDMALNGQSLKVARDLLEDEGGVAAADRHRHQGGGWAVIEGGEASALLGHLAGTVFEQVGGGLSLDEANAEHGGILVNGNGISVSRQLNKLDSTTKYAIVKR